VGRLNELTAQVRESAATMAGSGKDIQAAISSLRRVSEEIETGMHEMVSGAEQITRTVSRVNEISGENKDAISALSGEVSKFTV